MADSAFYVLKRPCTLGEGPMYRASDSTLHYVDCLHSPPQLHILSLDPVSGEAVHPSKYSLETSDFATVNEDVPGFRVVNLADSVTVMGFRKNHPGSYICLYYQGMAFMDEKTGKLDVIHEIIPTEDRHLRRFNDGGVDPAGRFWGAEIDVKALSQGANGWPKDYTPIGRLWRYDPADGSLKQMESGLACGNGIGWSPDNKTMYLNDSAAQLIFAYDYDETTGDISNKRVFKSYVGTVNEPDGMVLDSDGNLYIAMYNGHCIKVLDKTGAEIRHIASPAKAMACTTWGGRDNNVLYCVSAYDRSATRDPSDQGGHLFKYQIEAKGLVKFEFAG